MGAPVGPGWCNCSTTDFGSVRPGSSPESGTRRNGEGWPSQVGDAGSSPAGGTATDVHAPGAHRTGHRPRRRRLQFDSCQGHAGVRPVPRGVERQARPAVTREIQVRVLAGEFDAICPPRRPGVTSRSSTAEHPPHPREAARFDSRRDGCDRGRRSRGARLWIWSKPVRVRSVTPLPRRRRDTRARVARRPSGTHIPGSPGSTPGRATTPHATAVGGRPAQPSVSRVRLPGRARRCSAVGAWALSRATAPRAACSKPAGSPIARAVT